MILIKRHSWRPALRMLVMGSITLALGGCATNLTTAIVPPPTPLAMAVRLCDSAASSCVSAGSFSLASIRDLNVNVDWQNVPGGTHTQQLAMVLPNGVAYQTISQGFGIAEGTAGTPTRSGATPAARTLITQRQLTGDWTI